jgi:nucleoside-diphosphate-sugar epimerase
MGGVAVPVVVTGSSGFVGSHLVEALLGRGERVIGIDRVPAAASHGFEPVVAEIVHDDRVTDALRTADAVFHLAGCPGVRDTALDVTRRRWHDNVLATETVLAAVPPRTTLVVTSSSSVYGGAAGPGARGCRETDPVRPRGGYAHSKAAVEARCAHRLSSGGAIGVARPFTVAGERQRPDMALATWLAAASAGRPIRLLGSPARTRDVTDVRDVVRALIAMADRGVTGPLNVGTGVGHRLDELVAAVLTVTGAPASLVVVPASPEEVRHTRADTALMARRLGFVPSTDLLDVVARQAAAARVPALVGAVP